MLLCYYDGANSHSGPLGIRDNVHWGDVHQVSQGAVTRLSGLCTGPL